MRTIFTLMTVLFLVVVSDESRADSEVSSSDADLPQLQHNPFTRPAVVNDTNMISDSPSSLAWPYVLQATLVAGANSLANIDGHLLGIGEDYKGYVLTRVGEGTATFTRNNSELTVVVGDQETSEDDE